MPGGTNKKPADTGQRVRKERRRSPRGRRATDRLLRSVRKHKEDILVGPLKICDQHKKVFIHGKDTYLTPIEYSLLRILAAEKDRVLSYEELAQTLPCRKRIPDPEEIKKYIYRLRKKIEPDPCAPRWIQNVRGIGYQLVLDDDDNATPDPSSDV